MPADTVYFGEIGLSGAIRPVTQMQARLKEAAKLGFGQAVGPNIRGEKGERPLPGAVSLRHIADLVAAVASSRPRPKPLLQARKG